MLTASVLRNSESANATVLVASATVVSRVVNLLSRNAVAAADAASESDVHHLSVCYLLMIPTKDFMEGFMCYRMSVCSSLLGTECPTPVPDISRYPDIWVVRSGPIIMLYTHYN